MAVRHNLVKIRKILALEALAGEEMGDVTERPLNRGSCDKEARPCCRTTCRHNLFLDVNEDTGSITFNFPDIDPKKMKYSCALDEADRGGLTLEETGLRLGLTRERIRQIEGAALEKLKAAAKKGRIQKVDFEALANIAGAGHALSDVHATKD